MVECFIFPELYLKQDATANLDFLSNLEGSYFASQGKAFPIYETGLKKKKKLI